jgi:hypothetical protein
MFQSKIVVFKEITIDGNLFFQWFKCSQDFDTDWIIPDKLFTPEQHWKELEAD